MPVIDLGRVVGPQGPQGETGPAGSEGQRGEPGLSIINSTTDTTLSGALVGANGKVGARPISTTPAAGSSNLVTSGGIYTAIANATRSAVLYNASGGTLITANTEIALSASYQGVKLFVMWIAVGGFSASVIVPGFTLTIPGAVAYSVRSGSGGGVADSGCIVWGVVNNADSTRDYTKLRLVGIYNASGAVTNAYLRQIQGIF